MLSPYFKQSMFTRRLEGLIVEPLVRRPLRPGGLSRLFTDNTVPSASPLVWPYVRLPPPHTHHHTSRGIQAHQEACITGNEAVYSTDCCLRLFHAAKSVSLITVRRVFFRVFCLVSNQRCQTSDVPSRSGQSVCEVDSWIGLDSCICVRVCVRVCVCVSTIEQMELKLGK